MIEQQTLFSIPEPPPPAPKRQKHIDAAFTKADASFIALYEAFLFWYGATHKDFTAGEITAQFEAKHYKLRDKQKKALGGCYQRLLHRGKIEKTDAVRERDQGNLSRVYRIKK